MKMMFFSQIICHLTKKPEFDPDDATSDKSWARKLREDKLNWHGGIKMRQTYLAMKVSLSSLFVCL